MIRLIAFDLDGTALDEEKRLDPGLKEVLQKLEEKGIRYVPVSGRNEELINGYVDELRLQGPYVINNGGNIHQRHECLYNYIIPREYNRIITGELTKNEIPFRFFSLEKTFGYSSSPFFDKRMNDALRRMMVPFDPDYDLESLSAFKITADFSTHQDRAEEVSRTIRERCPNMNFLRSENWCWCANALDANKGEALKKVCGILGISLDEVMAFGDNVNDLPMLEIAGVSVAMGNSEEGIKEKCDYVCADNDHCGVSAFLRAYFNL